MARMIPLNPAPTADIGQGPYSLVPTEAGRYAQGLRFTCQVWNGQCLQSMLVLANTLAPAVAALAQQYTLPPDEVQRAFLDLITAIEGMLRNRRRSRAGQNSDPRAEIELTPEITEIADQTEAALLGAAQAPALYQRASRLVMVTAGRPAPPGITRPADTPVIWPLTAPLLADITSQAARFYTVQEGEKSYCRPPGWLMQTLLARVNRPFPVLKGLMHAPTLRPDGSLLDAEGYDPSTEIYVDFGGVQYPAIPSRPSRDEAREALKTLAEPLVDFPFAEPCHLSAAIAMQLTAMCRPCIDGPVPMGGITATAQGSGKGHLAKVIAIASTGRECAFWPQPSNEEEERKRLLAIGLQGDSIVCIDNVTKPFGSGTFAGVMTSMAWKDRILGFSENVEVPIRCLWLCTGNNLTYVGDMARRVVPIVIDPRMEKPEERTGFTHPDLLSWVSDHRAELVTAAITVMLAYAQAGWPPQTTQSYGSFERWYERICGALMWAGHPDPCEGRKALQVEVEDELLNFRQLVLCWYTCYHATLSTPRTLKQVAFESEHEADPQSPNEWDDLRDALGAFDPKYDGKHLDTRPAGYALRKYKGRVVDKKRFIADQHTNAGAPWHIEVV